MHTELASLIRPLQLGTVMKVQSFKRVIFLACFQLSVGKELFLLWQIRNCTHESSGTDRCVLRTARLAAVQKAPPWLHKSRKSLLAEGNVKDAHARTRVAQKKAHKHGDKHKRANSCISDQWMTGSQQFSRLVLQACINITGLTYTVDIHTPIKSQRLEKNRVTFTKVLHLGTFWGLCSFPFSPPHSHFPNNVEGKGRNSAQWARKDVFLKQHI